MTHSPSEAEPVEAAEDVAGEVHAEATPRRGAAVGRERAERARAAMLSAALLTAPVSPAWAAPKKKPEPVKVTPSPVPDTATITVSSLTRGAEVFLNDDRVGEVPLPAPLTVKPGETYSIRVQKRGYAPFVDTVIAGAGQDSHVEADLIPTMGVLKIDCNVLRAQVSLSGKPMGRTPFDGDVPPGNHELRVVAPGYLQEVRMVQMEAGQPQALDITLAAVPAPAVIVDEDTSVLSRWWFWTAVGVLVVGGVTAGVVATQGPRHVPAGEPDGRVTLP